METPRPGPDIRSPAIPFDLLRVEVLILLYVYALLSPFAVYFWAVYAKLQLQWNGRSVLMPVAVLALTPPVFSAMAAIYWRRSREFWWFALLPGVCLVFWLAVFGVLPGY